MRRRAGALAASTAALAATMPVLLRRAGASDWTDGALGLIVGLSLGIAAILMVVTLRRIRNSP
jgi:hypothetical protein